VDGAKTAPPLSRSLDFCMEIIRSQRNAELGILLTWCAYIAFAVLTDLKDYELVARPERHLRWTIIRLSTVTFWLFVASLFIRYRKHPVNWLSFIYSFIATSVIAIVISPSLVSKSINGAIVIGTIAFYALVSGFLCVTLRKPIIAALLGLICFAAQFLIDATAHIFSGVFRFN
jgi:hypothetical protein